MIQNPPVQAKVSFVTGGSSILLAVAYYDVSTPVSFILWLVGVILQLSLTLAILSQLIFKHRFQMTDFNAAWFIPIVGNIIVPIAGVYFIPTDTNWIFFSMGLVFSIVYLTFLFNRVIFHPPIPEHLLYLIGSSCDWICFLHVIKR